MEFSPGSFRGKIQSCRTIQMNAEPDEPKMALGQGQRVQWPIEPIIWGLNY